MTIAVTIITIMTLTMNMTITMTTAIMINTTMTVEMTWTVNAVITRVIRSIVIPKMAIIKKKIHIYHHTQYHIS